jgi:DNA repair protein RecO (recombination protein O)
MKHGQLHLCWLLHARAYRDSSLLLELFSQQEGRVGAIARGVRSGSKAGPSRKRSFLQPFIPLQLALSGRGELRTVGQLEALGSGIALQGERLMSALYVNELLVRLLPVHEKEAALFEEYGTLLRSLAGPQPLEPLLRNFELTLLDALGYGLQFDHDAQSGVPLRDDCWYHLHADGGFGAQLSTPDQHDQETFYRGAELLMIARRDFSQENARKTAKRLLRIVLQRHLGQRELVSRTLFGKVTLPTSPSLA